MKRKWFASDLAFKIYSVLISIFLWIFVIYDQNPESTKIVRNIPISYSNLDSLERAGYTIVKEDDLFVDFKIKGKRVSLGSLAKNSVRASISFSDLSEGEYNLMIDARLPQNDMTVVDKSPETVTIKVEKLITKELPVGIIYTGTNADGKLASAKLRTTIVTVMGPESIMNKVKNAKVTLDYAAVASVASGTSDIHIYDENGEDITYDKNLRLNTDRTIWEQTIYNVTDADIDIIFASSANYFADSLKIVDSIKFTAENPSEFDFDKVPTSPLSNSEAKKLKDGKSVNVKLILPNGISLLKQDENGIWKIDETNAVELTGNVVYTKKIIPVSGVNLHITDKKDGKTYTISDIPEIITLKSTGEINISDSDISFKVDVKDLNDGEHTVKISSNLPEGLTFEKDYTAKISVKNN